MNWNDLTYLLAIIRGGSLARAASFLRVDKSTVSRRLAALEADLQVALTERTRDGRITLTGAGRNVLARAEVIEDEIRKLESDLGRARALVGRVRLTAVPLLINHLLLPNLAALQGQNPQLALDLIADARDLSLSDFDADIALRLARPRTGGQGVIARKIGTLTYGAYATAAAGDDPGWIGYEARMLYLDHAAAIERLASQPGQTRVAVAVNDGETLLQMVLAGQGKSLVPRLIAGRFDGLVECAVPQGMLPLREVWLMVRRDLRDLARIRAVIDWLDTLIPS